MKLFGSIKELVSAVFRKDTYEITLRPNQTTSLYTAARDVQLPQQNSDAILVSRNSSDTLTNKTIDGDDNTLQDISISSLKTALVDANKAIVRDASGTVTSALIANSNVSATAAINYSKLALTNSIVNGDIASTTTIDGSKLQAASGSNAGAVTTGTQTFAGAKTFSSSLSVTGSGTFSQGVNSGSSTYPTYEANVDFGANAANTWLKIVTASLADTTYSSVGFKIEIDDPKANHAIISSVDNIVAETYYVACVRTETTVSNTPDACYVRGPGNTVQATKTSTGNYEIQIQNTTTNREFRVRVSVFASNGTHTVTYHAGATANAGTAQYVATVSTTSKSFFQNIDVKSTATAAAFSGPLTGNVTGNVSGTAANVTGTVAITNGGTGQTTQQAALNALVGTQVANRVLRSDGTNMALSQVNLGTDVGGTLPIGNGGTGAATQQAAINALTGAQVSGRYLRSDGTNASLSSIQAADVPTLNQNTTGTAANITATSNNTLTTLSSLSLPGSQVSGNISGNAANVTGTVAITNGGTGQTTQQAAINALVGTQTANRVLRSNGTNMSLSQVALGTDVSGTLPIANGGSGQTSANAALNAFLPAQSGYANKYLKTDGANTSWASASGGAGEINAILNSSGADGITGWTAGTSHDTPVAFSGANNPLDGIVPTAFSFTATAGTASASSGQSGIGIYDDMTLPTGLQNRKLKIEFSYSTPASSAGTWAVVLYQGTTRVVLSTDSSGDTVLPAGVTGGKFTAYFDSSSASAYRLLLVQRTRTSTNNLYLTNIIVGPGIQPQGAVVGPWISYTPTIGGFGSGAATVAGKYRQVGTSAELMISLTNITSAGTGTDTLTFSLPPGLTVTFANLPVNGVSGANHVGTVQTFGITATNQQGFAQVAYTVTSTTLGILKANTTVPVRGQDIPLATIEIGIKATVPIAEWAGSGTVQLAQNDVEYAWNSDTTDANNTTSFGYGPAGAQFGSFTAQRSKRVKFQTPIQATDILSIEFYKSGTWFKLNDQFTILQPYTLQNTTTYGAGLDIVDSTSVDVYFGQYRLSSGATYATTGTAWSGIAGSSSYLWRVRKQSAGAAVGFGIVQPGVSSGLVSASGVPGNTTGNAIASGYVGEMAGSQRSGTNGFSYSTRSTTAVPATTAASVISVALNKGVYLVSYKIRCSSNTTSNLDAMLYIGGTAVESTNSQGTATSAQFASAVGSLPIVITADGTTIAVYARLDTGTSSGNLHELWATRIA